MGGFLEGFHLHKTSLQSLGRLESHSFSLLLLFVQFDNIFGWYLCFVRLTCWLTVIWMVRNKKVFLIVQQSVTKADQLCFVWTENFVVQLRYVLINLGLAENCAGLIVQVGLVLF